MKLISEFVTKDCLHDYIESVFGKIIFLFPVMHFNKEGDNFGYVVQRNGKRLIVMSNNNKLYVSNTEEIDRKIQEYNKNIFELKKAICLCSYEQG